MSYHRPRRIVEALAHDGQRVPDFQQITLRLEYRVVDRSEDTPVSRLPETDVLGRRRDVVIEEPTYAVKRHVFVKRLEATVQECRLA